MNDGRSKLVSIANSEAFSPITNADYENLAAARRQARRSCLIAITAQMHIEEKLRRGARDLSTRYVYDLASGDLTPR